MEKEIMSITTEQDRIKVIEKYNIDRMFCYELDKNQRNMNLMSKLGEQYVKWFLWNESVYELTDLYDILS